MGLFDLLPAPTKQAGATKRAADSLVGPDEEGDSKKVRQAEPANSQDAAGQQQPLEHGGSGAAAGASSSFWTGSLQAAYSEDKGSRLAMEDVAVINCDAGTEATAGCRLSIFGIFDGHGGSNVARYVADNLHACVLEAGLEQEAARLAAAATDAAGSGGEAQPPAAQVKQCKAAVVEGFQRLDKRVLEQCAAAGWQDGCTAVVAYVVGDTVLVANVGDARCVLARRPQAPAVAAGEAGAGRGGSQAEAEQQREDRQHAQRAAQDSVGTGQQQQQQEQEKTVQQEATPLKAITLTREHKAIFPQERQRIEKAGSFVSGDGRLAGRIEVSRAFGDRLFKKQGMSAAPDIQAFQLSQRDAFLLLACDGFWGVFSPQDAVDFAARELALGKGVKQSCNRLIYEAIRERKCKDNCTVMLVQLC